MIFVHGLGGDPWKTWCQTDQTNENLFHWLEGDVTEVAVWTVGYPASVSRWHGTAMHLVDRATSVLSLLLAEPGLRYGDIILVGHSLGGLVVKQVVRAAEAASHTDQRTNDFLSNVRGVAFFATPHAGSGLANWADRLRVLLRPSTATMSLVRNDPNLRDLNNWYRQWVARTKVEHLILTESHSTSIFGLVVQADSADPGLSVTAIPLDADHSSICKPGNRDDQSYKLLREFVSRRFDRGVNIRDTERKLGDHVDRLAVILSAHDQRETQITAALDELTKAIGLQVQATSHTSSDPQDMRRFGGLVPILDNAIREALDTLRRARFFHDHPSSDSAKHLAERLRFGELAAGSPHVRCIALSWCARILGSDASLELADSLIEAAKRLGGCAELQIAEARRIAATGNLADALAHLAPLETSSARSAAFIFVSIAGTAESSLDWLSRSGLSFGDFDGDGKFFVLSRERELGRWTQHFEHANCLTDGDFQETPALLHTAALASLLRTVPEELRHIVSGQLPIDLKGFPLASNSEALQARRNARSLFRKCAEAAKNLGCLAAANVAEDYALWLDLLDPLSTAQGRLQLQDSLRHASHSLRRVHFAFEFDVPLDPAAVEAEIDRTIAQSGGPTVEVAAARLALTLRNREPRTIADYISRYRDQLTPYIDGTFLGGLEVEALARAGLVDKAKSRLTELVGLRSADRDRLSDIVSEIAEGDTTVALRRRYEASHSLPDLANLVRKLDAERDWENLAVFARILFEQTNTIPDAEVLAQALQHAQRLDQLRDLLHSHQDLVQQSDGLCLLSCWLSYRDGDLKRAEEQTRALRARKDTEQARNLAVSIAIAIGDWGTLAPLLEQEWTDRNARTPKQLIRAARLAYMIGSPRSRGLLLAAAEKGENDAAVLSSAYFLATTAGWEDDPLVGRWLAQAMALSDSGGPLQKLSLREMLDRQPEWARRERETLELLRRAQLPVFGAARILNRSLVQSFLLPALSNTSQSDPRKRQCIPAYSGTRRLQVPTSLTRIALDPSALLTLAHLGLLDVARTAFSSVVVPHATLGWLFEEKHGSAFHQPSRIRHAHELRRLVATGAVMEFRGSTRRDPDLAAEIGDELASLIAEATREVSASSDPPRLVVVAGPIHRIGSLMMEEANLSRFRDAMTSCLAVVHKLRRMGQITVDEEQQAVSYLTSQGKDLRTRAEIPDNATLYLDDLAADHLRRLGLLDKLRSANFSVFVSHRELNEANELIEYEALSGKVADAIESLRTWLTDGIRSGSYRLGSFEQTTEGDPELTSHPTFAAVSLVTESDVDALISDDRFLNQHNVIDEAERKTPVLTTIDLLDRFLASGAVSEGQWRACRTTLRSSGYLFVPLSADELNAYLVASTVVEGQLVECAELRVIRENLLVARMGGFHQLPSEAPWLDGVATSLVQTLRNQWSPAIPDELARARSAWLTAQLDMRGWSVSLGASGNTLAEAGYAMRLMQLMVTTDMAPEVADRYGTWLDDAVLSVVEEEDPQTYEWIVKRSRQLVAGAVRSHTSEGQE